MLSMPRATTIQCPPTCTPSISSPTRSSASSGVARHASSCAWVCATKRRLTALLLVPPVVTSAPSGSRLRAYWRVATPISIWSTTRRFSGSAFANARAVGNGTSSPARRARGRRIATFRPPSTDLTRRMPRSIRLARRLMRISWPTDGGPILFQHGFEYLQARRDDQLLERGLRINEDIDQRKVPWRRGYRLATARDCARLLLHGGSLLGGLHLGFVTGRIARPSEEPPLQISTATGTSPGLRFPTPSPPRRPRSKSFRLTLKPCTERPVSSVRLPKAAPPSPHVVERCHQRPRRPCRSG